MVKSWNTSTSAFDITEHVETFDIDRRRLLGADVSCLERHRSTFCSHRHSLCMWVLCSAAALLLPPVTAYSGEQTPGPNEQASQTKMSLEQLWDMVRTVGDRPGYERPYDVNWETGFSEGLGEIEIDGKWGFVDAKGRIVVPARYDQAMPFSGGLAPVRKGAIFNHPDAALFGMAGAWRWVNRDGQEIAGGYLICMRFAEGLAVVTGGKWCGFASSDGKLAIPAKYLRASAFSEGLAAVEDQLHRRGYINPRGEYAIPARFQLAGQFDQGRAVVLEDNSYKIIDAAGAQVALLPYERLQELRFREGMLPAAKDGKWGFVNDAGQLVIPCQFEWVDPFHEGLAAAARDGKIGFINRQGEFVIQPEFDLILDMDGANRPYQPDPCYFSEGVAAVPKDGKWGYIARNGQWVIKPQFDKAGPFTEGAAKVAVNNRMGYIDRTGKYNWEPSR